MQRRISAVFASLLVALLNPAAPSGATEMTKPGVAAPMIGVERLPLFARMMHANSALHSSQSRVHLKIAMHTFPFLSPTLDGKAYYKAPAKNAIIFDSVPALAALFKKVFPRLDPPAAWPRLYHMSIASVAAGRTTFRLEPRKYGTIEYLEVMIDDASALPVGYTYQYRNGGHIHFDQTVERRHDVYVITALNGHVELPSTSADASSTFSDYVINGPISDSIFNESS